MSVEIKKYRLADDGSVIQAATPLIVIVSMRDSSKFAHNEKIVQFMEGFSARYKEQTGHIIRTEQADWFVNDLIACGYLTEI